MLRRRKDIFTKGDLVNERLTTVFAEQPLILPRSAKYTVLHSFWVLSILKDFKIAETD